jgi:radical SAM superfamily enzyme with C-terminal helix-hairpin-helix motif
VSLIVVGWASSVSAQVGKALDPPVLDVNLASKDDLVKAPHMTEVIVDELITKRPFLSVKDVNEYFASKMLTEAQRKELYEKVFLHINLNTATREEIMLVPGINERMAHEFEEYRPYRAIDQFRREMSKYVNEEQVGKYEQYVFVPIDIDTASEEVIMTIPGMTDRMAHEFEEYRPYNTDVAKFRREIVKYVNEKEVERLLRYTTLAPAPAAPAAPAEGATPPAAPAAPASP